MRKIVFIFVVLLLCAPLPLSVLKFLSNKQIIRTIHVLDILDEPLVGVTEIPELPKPSFRSLLNGTFQSGLEKYWNFKVFGRPAATRIYNQFLYSFFYSQNNDNIVLGKNGYFYVTGYLSSYLREPAAEDKSELFKKMSSLAVLQKKIKEMGKSLFVIITPSKASLYPEYFPRAYDSYVKMKNSGQYAQNYYEYFISRAGEAGLDYYDYHSEFHKLKEKGISPFTKGGIHWTGITVVPYFQGLTDRISEVYKKTGTIKTIKAEPVWGDAFSNEDDIEANLNIFPAYKNLPELLKTILPFYRYIFPKAQYYSYHMTVMSVPAEYKPAVFVCGGSFNWMWSNMLYGLEGWVTHGEGSVFDSTEFSWYNSYIVKYPENKRIFDKTEDFNHILSNDIIIIEFNEEVVSPEMKQFIFAKNLLDYINKEEKGNK